MFPSFFSWNNVGNLKQSKTIKAAILQHQNQRNTLPSIYHIMCIKLINFCIQKAGISKFLKMLSEICTTLYSYIHFMSTHDQPISMICVRYVACGQTMVGICISEKMYHAYYVTHSVILDVFRLSCHWDILRYKYFSNQSYNSIDTLIVLILP